MSLVKFYRGSANVSLPAHSEGSIFVIARDDTHGDIYVDVEQGKRLHIVPDSPVEWDSEDNYNEMTTTRSELGKLYLVDNYKQDSQGNYIPGVKIGDGNAWIADLPILELITAEEKDFINSRVTAYEELISGSDYRLVLTMGMPSN